MGRVDFLFTTANLISDGNIVNWTLHDPGAISLSITAHLTICPTCNVLPSGI